MSRAISGMRFAAKSKNAGFNQEKKRFSEMPDPLAAARVFRIIPVTSPWKRTWVQDQ